VLGNEYKKVSILTSCCRTDKVLEVCTTIAIKTTVL